MGNEPRGHAGWGTPNEELVRPRQQHEKLTMSSMYGTSEIFFRGKIRLLNIVLLPPVILLLSYPILAFVWPQELPLYYDYGTMGPGTCIVIVAVWICFLLLRTCMVTLDERKAIVKEYFSHPFLSSFLKSGAVSGLGYHLMINSHFSSCF